MRLSLRWAERSKVAFSEQPGKAIFGIVQGGVDESLRIESAEGLVGIGFRGYAIGGLAVGEPQAAMLEIIEAVVPRLPPDKPRYLMGVGTPDDLLQSLRRGVDMFDCVMPTRSGRTGQAFTRRGKVNIRNARHLDDPRPVQEGCRCRLCRTFSRAYLAHLFRAEELLAYRLATCHNLTFTIDFMAGIRLAIEAGTLHEMRRLASVRREPDDPVNVPGT